MNQQLGCGCYTKALLHRQFQAGFGMLARIPVSAGLVSLLNNQVSNVILQETHGQYKMGHLYP